MVSHQEMQSGLNYLGEHAAGTQQILFAHDFSFSPTTTLGMPYSRIAGPHRAGRQRRVENRFPINQGRLPAGGSRHPFRRTGWHYPAAARRLWPRPRITHDEPVRIRWMPPR